MHQIYLFATLSKNGAVMEEIRYLHSSFDTRGEADVHCEDLNSAIVSVGYRVVEVS